MSNTDDAPVLIFFADFNDVGPPTLKVRTERRLRLSAKRIINRPTVTGFEMWTRLLVRALENQGRTVRINDYRAARAAPDRPVGLTGYPQILDWWDLPNPAILGPGLLDHPAIAPTLMDNPRFHHYIVTCDWMRRVFEPFYGPKLLSWFAGIDTEAWPDTTPLDKTYDCLIYDKIRWDRDLLVPKLLHPIQRALDERGLRHTSIRYGRYDQRAYHQALMRSRTVIFLCEHETQGFAYQEAMASNLPVFAWDPGFWADPNRAKYSADEVATDSVPYFSPDCGLKFRDLGEFDSAVDSFFNSVGTFQPRRFVERELTFSRSAEIYTRCYDALRES